MKSMSLIAIYRLTDLTDLPIVQASPLKKKRKYFKKKKGLKYIKVCAQSVNRSNR